MNFDTNVIAATVYGIFGLVGIIISARLNRKVKRADTKLELIREQVENGHSKNMRVESDERHEDNTDKLDKIIRNQSSMRGLITRQGGTIKKNTELLGVMTTRITTLTEASLRHDTQIHDIEHTIPRAMLPKRKASPRA